jgi:hypothetical protein
MQRRLFEVLLAYILNSGKTYLTYFAKTGQTGNRRPGFFYAQNFKKADFR